jgi:hypothetical protein
LYTDEDRNSHQFNIILSHSLCRSLYLSLSVSIGSLSLSILCLYSSLYSCFNSSLYSCFNYIPLHFLSLYLSLARPPLSLSLSLSHPLSLALSLCLSVFLLQSSCSVGSIVAHENKQLYTKTGIYKVSNTRPYF